MSVSAIVEQLSVLVEKLDVWRTRNAAADIEDCEPLPQECVPTLKSAESAFADYLADDNRPKPAKGVDAKIDRAEVLKHLPPAERKAYLAYQFAETKAGKTLEDREAYELIRENGIPTESGDLGELMDYDLPDCFETWSRYLRAARNPLGEQKYSSRGGRSTGKSVVRSDEL